ncbi:HAD-IA family hydrolase [Cutibacterium sp. WCA-380-WT-3A]|uniref:HAD-IA family hydrolase n=1 Tax=Cutibacterium porci TaxID=2605781 RepID=A0A7K0JA66_9ACTN|nr:HAD-IA family hydrolase [Cutibacterium porci]MSS46703.1 HAD-IA family hydrolase [Cutibacterium porci]
MRSIIWDMGGTLIDTYPEVDQTLAEVVWATPGKEQLAEVAQLRSASIAHAIDALADRYQVSSKQLNDAYSALKKKWIHDPAPLMAGADEAMAAVRRGGGLNLVATHRDRTSAENLLKALGVQVDDLVCAPDGFARKPDPHMNQVLMERHGLSPTDVIAVGDRLIDVEAARSAGIEGILVAPKPYPHVTTITSLTELLDRL